MAAGPGGIGEAELQSCWGGTEGSLGSQLLGVVKEGLGAGLSTPWGQMGWRRTEGGKADTRMPALMPSKADSRALSSSAETAQSSHRGMDTEEEL